jgi:hypothetical protein
MPALVLASPAAAQSPAPTSWQAHADLSRARSAVDSFTVLMRDKPIGWQRLQWAKQGKSEWIMSDEIALNGITQRSDVRFSASLVEQALRQQGMAGPTAMKIELDRRNGRIAGTALTPTGGANPAPIDVPAADDVIDDNALTVILPLVKWKEGLTFTIPVLSSGIGTLETYTAAVVDKRSTTVPAGTFEVWHVTLAGAKYTIEADVTTTAPYRVVRFGPRGAPMSAQLVR